MIANQMIYPTMAIMFAAASDIVVDNAANINGGILDKHELLAWCVMGAVFGGFLASQLFSHTEDTQKAKSMKFCTSVVASMSFTPMVMLYWNVKPVPEWTLGTSTSIAIIGVGVIKAVAMAWTKYFILKFKPPG